MRTLAKPRLSSANGQHIGQAAHSRFTVETSAGREVAAPARKWWGGGLEPYPPLLRNNRILADPSQHVHW
jgi:hypothetical protein